jgi:hypothetical protein
MFTLINMKDHLAKDLLYQISKKNYVKRKVKFIFVSKAVLIHLLCTTLSRCKSGSLLKCSRLEEREYSPSVCSQIWLIRLTHLGR